MNTTSGNETPAITIAICTYNRCTALEETLASLSAVRIPEGQPIEVLVIDNNSTDGTRHVIERIRASHPGSIRHLFERRQGLSHARNAAIACARAPILAYADDDVLFHPDWLVALLEPFSADPDLIAVGGRAVPIFEGGEPPWLTPYLASVYGELDAGSRPRTLRYPEHPYGLNMAFRRKALEALGGFNPELGRSGRNLLSGEETELFARVHRAGLKTAYTPNAVVFHRIPRSRATRSWALRRYYWAGVSRAIMHRALVPLTVGERLRLAYYEIAHLSRMVARQHWRFVQAVGRSDGESVESLARAAQRVGALRAYLFWCRAPAPGT